jgi:hypothetical protein
MSFGERSSLLKSFFDIYNKDEENSVSGKYSSVIFSMTEENANCELNFGSKIKLTQDDFAIINVAPFSFSKDASMVCACNKKLYVPIPIIPLIKEEKEKLEHFKDNYMSLQSKNPIYVGVYSHDDAGIYVHKFMEYNSQYAGRIKFLFIHNFEEFEQVKEQLDFYWITDNSFEDNVFAVQSLLYRSAICCSLHDTGDPKYMVKSQFLNVTLENILKMSISKERNRNKFNMLCNLQHNILYSHSWETGFIPNLLYQI